MDESGIGDWECDNGIFYQGDDTWIVHADLGIQGVYAGCIGMVVLGAAVFCR